MVDVRSRSAVVSTWFPRSLASTIGLVLVLFLSGCGGDTEGTVTGKVTYQGAPVPAGMVNFAALDKGIASQAELSETGSFTLPGTLPPGSYKVYFQPPLPQQLPPGSPQPKAPPAFKLPAKFLDVQKSTVTQEIVAGANDIAISLTD